MRELIVNIHPKSPITEAIKTIKTNLRFSGINSKMKTILITSSVIGEGKSFVSSNLAVSFANSGEKVLIVDCDLRRGRQAEIFEIATNLGLSDLLIDKNWTKNQKKYLIETRIPNLTVLTAGTVPPNPSLLLESQKMEEIMEELKNRYDRIIFDTPPVMGLPDTLIMSRLADIVLIVARAKKTTVELLESTQKDLKNVNANIVGIILNRVERQNKKYYSHYYNEES